MGCECAKRELTEYAALSQDAVQKQRAMDLLDDMDGRKERYLELTDAARAELAEVRLNPGKCGRPLCAHKRIA